MIWPLWQYPHWTTSSRLQASWTASATGPFTPSIVTTSRSPTWERGVMQARTASPPTCTVHAPHWAIPQPYLVPVRRRSSRKTQSSGVSGVDVTSRELPLTRKSAMVPPRESPTVSYGCAGGL